MDDVEEVVLTVGLGHVGIYAEIDGLLLAGRMGPGRNDDDGQVDEPGIRADLPQDLEAVHAGQHEIEEEEIEAPAPQQGETLTTVGGTAALIPAGTEDKLQQPKGLGVVVDGQYLNGHLIS